MCVCAKDEIGEAGSTARAMREQRSACVSPWVLASVCFGGCGVAMCRWAAWWGNMVWDSVKSAPCCQPGRLALESKARMRRGMW